MKLNFKKTLAALAAAAVLPTAAQAAGIMIDPDGAGPLGAINVAQLDWKPTTLLGIGATTAISTWINNAQQGNFAPVPFDIVVMATLGSTSAPGGATNTPAGLGSTYEWTLVARFTDLVTSAFVNPITGGGTATFLTDITKPGYVELYYGSPANADQLAGSGFNDGRLILKATTLTGATGSFTVDSVEASVALDQTTADPTPNNDYPGQNTLVGSGGTNSISVGNITADPTFFLANPGTITLSFGNISEQVPFVEVDPATCFTVYNAATGSGLAVGASTVAPTQCDGYGLIRVNGPYSGQPADPNGGYIPLIGPVNGVLAIGGSPEQPIVLGDAVYQTDFNSTITGIPEPGTLALLGIALAGLGFGAARRKG